jgi:hypothetical protein
MSIVHMLKQKIAIRKKILEKLKKMHKTFKK